MIFLSLAAVVAGVAAWVDDFAATYLLGWTSAGFSIIALAYFGERPQLFGKRASGTLAPWAVVSCLPVFLLNYGLYYLQRIVRSEEAANAEVAPDWFGGRMPTPAELPAGTTTIVDLTAELIAHPEVRAHAGYRSFPMLDDGFPASAELERIVSALVDRPGPMLIHCAAGHGRSATLAAALGLVRGHFDDPNHAEQQMRLARPRIKLRSLQRERLRQWFEGR